jgi:hypothetical protein
MRMYGPLIVVAAAIVCISSLPRSSGAQTGDALAIADNDSVYIDAKSFKIVPGKKKGDTSALIERLNARNLGPGTIVFRSGDALYIADAPPVVLAQLGDRYGSDRYGSDRETSVSAAQAEREWQEYLRQNRYGGNRYGSDRYGSDRDTSVSAAQAEREWQEYLRQNRYGSDRYGTDPAQQRVYIIDPEYAQYKLKKFFEDNWTTSDSN